MALQPDARRRRLARLNRIRSMPMSWQRFQNSLVRRINRLRPFRAVTIAELAAADPSCWQPVHPAWQSAWPARLDSGAPVPELLASRLSHALPARGVLRLRDASVLGDHGWIFTAANRLIPDTTVHVDFSRWTPRNHLPLLRGGARRLPGRTLSLLSNWSATNFYHMLVETIPRLELLFAAGWKWSDFDQILLPAFSTPTINRLLAPFALPAGKIIRVEWGSLNYFRTEELICTSFPGGRRTVLPEQINYLRGLHRPAPETGTPPRRLFVRRRARTRALRNEAELLPLLAARGFTIVDPAELPDVEAVFHGADFIVAPHGAALANLVFSRPGTKVLELIPSDQAYPYFYTLCIHGGIGYDCLLGPSDLETPRHPAAQWNSPSDFTIDTGAFACALDRLLAT